jgi:hypothetical protein
VGGFLFPRVGPHRMFGKFSLSVIETPVNEPRSIAVWSTALPMT